MKLTYWKNTSDDGDRRARRMAECLVPGPLPLEAFIGIAARTDQQVAHAEALLTTLDVEIPVRPRPNWYFD